MKYEYNTVSGTKKFVETLGLTVEATTPWAEEVDGGVTLKDGREIQVGDTYWLVYEKAMGQFVEVHGTNLADLRMALNK